MSLLQALEEQETQAEHGWTGSNAFGQNMDLHTLHEHGSEESFVAMQPDYISNSDVSSQSIVNMSALGEGVTMDSSPVISNSFDYMQQCSEPGNVETQDYNNGSDLPEVIPEGDFSLVDEKGPHHLQHKQVTQVEKSNGQTKYIILVKKKSTTQQAIVTTEQSTEQICYMSPQQNNQASHILGSFSPQCTTSFLTSSILGQQQSMKEQNSPNIIRKPIILPQYSNVMSPTPQERGRGRGRGVGRGRGTGRGRGRGRGTHSFVYDSGNSNTLTYTVDHKGQQYRVTKQSSLNTGQPGLDLLKNALIKKNEVPSQSVALQQNLTSQSLGFSGTFQSPQQTSEQYILDVSLSERQGVKTETNLIQKTQLAILKKNSQKVDSQQNLLERHGQVPPVVHHTQPQTQTVHLESQAAESPIQPILSQNQSNVAITSLISSPSPLTCNAHKSTVLPKGTGSSSSSSAINRDNLLLQGASSLEQNMVYKIKEPNGAEKMMVWDGQQFQEFDSTTSYVQQESPENLDHISGGGQGSRQTQQAVQGNATGLLMISKNQPNQPQKQVMRVKKGSATTRGKKHILPNGRVWNYTNVPSTALARRPLHAGDEPRLNPEHIEIMESPPKNQPQMANEASTVQLSANSDQQMTQTTATVAQKSVDTEAFADEANKMVGTKRLGEFEDGKITHCRFCGYSSSCLNKCQRCGRILPKDTKIVIVEKAKKVCVDPKTLLDKKAFYGDKIKMQESVYKDGSTSPHVLKTPGSKYGRVIHLPGGKTYRNPRTIKKKEPETVTISSDEEDNESNKSAQTIDNKQNQNTQLAAIPDTVAKELQVTDVQPPSSPEIFPDILKNGPSSPKVTGTRRDRMGDEHGICALDIKNEHSLGGVSKKVKMMMEASQDEPDFSNLRLSLNTRNIRVGSIKSIPIQPLLISTEGIHFFVSCMEEEFQFNVYPSDILQMFANFKKQAVIFIHTTQDCGQRIRDALHVETVEDYSQIVDPYFDPFCNDIKRQLIILLLYNMNEEDQVQATRIFQAFKPHSQTKKEEFFSFVSSEEANSILRQTSPDALELDCKDEAPETSMTTSGNQTMPMEQEGNESPSPPRILFSGPILKLITYPPPPETGGIPVTNEDLYCLTEGEFLNDVIIDFYLKYLYREVLSEADRKRTHIFSSFFYKRLTQRARGSQHCEEDKITPAKRRHSRVKTWTRHVDLFSKDFIIVPINEHAHWFLAIICFPGLTAASPVRYIPVKHAEEGEQEEANSSQDHNYFSSDTAFEDEEDGDPDEMFNNDERCQDSEEAEMILEQLMMSQEVKREEVPLESETSMETDQPEPTPKPKRSKSKSRYHEIRGKVVDDAPQEEMGEQCEYGLRRPCILMFDSLAGPSRSSIVRTLREYLQVEWDTKKKMALSFEKDRVKGSTPKIPQQTNFSDCGVYILQYVESFFEDPIQDFHIPLKGLQNWFTPERVNRKRKEISDLVYALKEQYENRSNS